MGLPQLTHRSSTVIDTMGQCAINEEPESICGCVLYPSSLFIFAVFLFCASAVGLFYRLLDKLIVALGKEPVAEVRRNGGNPAGVNIEQDPNDEPQVEEGFAEVIAVLTENDSSSQWQFLDPVAVGVRISGREIDNGINIRFDAVPTAAAIPVNELTSGT